MEKKVVVTIKGSLGSEFQEYLFNTTLHTLLDALKLNLEGTHTKNKIIYEIDTQDGYKTKKY